MPCRASVSRQRFEMCQSGVWLVQAVAISIALALVGCDATPDYLRREAQERRLAELGMETVDPTGTSPDAGLSLTRKVRITPLDPGKLGGDTLSAGFHRFRHRCGTCHDPPAPRSHTSVEWIHVIPKMEGHIKDAGLIPLNGVDRQLILDYLRRHAAVR
jgi:hypothetical protein